MSYWHMACCSSACSSCRRFVSKTPEMDGLNDGAVARERVTPPSWVDVCQRQSVADDRLYRVIGSRCVPAGRRTVEHGSEQCARASRLVPPRLAGCSKATNGAAAATSRLAVVGNHLDRKGYHAMSKRDATWISDWTPDDEAFWEVKGKVIARRNLIWSILAEHIGFSVWLIWSIVAAKLPQAGFHYTISQLFQLVALPGLIGALMRFPYTFAVPRFGGRNWTMVSATLLLIPTILLAFFVTRPDTPFSLMLVVAATAGLGGGNFASSMANISFFYPDRMKGWALGINAAGGNIGVSTVQLLTPVLLGFGWVSLYLTSPLGPAKIYLQNAGLMWLPLIALAVYGASRYMNNLATARSTFQDQLVITRRKHTWVMSWLYIGTFGSFIGYSAAFPLLIKIQFPAITISIAFLGPLLGSVARPFGGLLADKIGGA